MSEKAGNNRHPEYASFREAATYLGMSSLRVRQLVQAGELDTELVEGKLMIARDLLAAYRAEREGYKPNRNRFGTCKDCGRMFERRRMSTGRANDKNAKTLTYRDGDLCTTCRKLRDKKPVQAYSSYKPHHGGQVEFHKAKERYKILSCGARWGKDRASINEFIKHFATMLSEDRGDDMIPKVHGWIVAPNFGLARQSWREIKAFFPEEWIERVYEGDKTILTIGDGVIEVKSADDPNALVSVGLDLVLMTEAARIANLEEVWSFLYARVQSPGRGPKGKGGIILANSTPRGKGYWYELYRRGDPSNPNRDPDFRSFHYTTWDNPYIRKEEKDKAKSMLPDRLYRQEHLAEFIESAENVFTNVRENATYDGPSEPQPEDGYIVAYDPARVVDYSCVGVRNLRGETVYMTRWSGKPWPEQIKAVAEISRYFNYAPVRVDCTGLGDTLVSALDRAGCVVEPVLFTQKSKEEMVNHLALLMEQRSISYPYIDYLIQELSDYRYTNLPGGGVRYSAPRGDGYYDDAVSVMMMLYSDFNQVDIDLGLFAGTDLLSGVSF